MPLRLKQALKQLSDDSLMYFMIGSDVGVAKIAAEVFKERHLDDKLIEPPHCPYCFEGCSKCEPKSEE